MRFSRAARWSSAVAVSLSRATDAIRALLFRLLLPLPQANEFHKSVKAAAGVSAAWSAIAKMSARRMVSPTKVSSKPCW